MRRLRCFALLLAFGGIGCVHPILKPKDGLTTMKQATRTVPTNGEVQVAIASRLLDQTAGNDYLTRGLWRDTSSPLSHELTTLLAINGLRIGILGGTRPQEFQTLMTSEASVLNPMIRTTSIGRPRVLPVNGPLESCEIEFTKQLITEAETQTFAVAECGLQVTPTLAPGGKVKLRCELQIQHGDRQPFLKPTSDGSGFTRQDHRPTEQFSTLSFEVTLDREEVMVIGAGDEPTGTLGQPFFFASGTDRLRQRVLVVQANLSTAAEESPSKKPSLSPAARAGTLTIRRE